MLKNEYLQLIFKIRETHRQYDANEITQEEALLIFDILLDKYIKLDQESDKNNLKYKLEFQN